MTTAKKTATNANRCEQENQAGVRCVYGPNHSCACRFKPIDLSGEQYDLLDQIGRFPIRKFTCLASSEAAILKALSARGLIGKRWVSGRAWDAWLLPAGRRILLDRPM